MPVVVVAAGTVLPRSCDEDSADVDDDIDYDPIVVIEQLVTIVVAVCAVELFVLLLLSWWWSQIRMFSCPFVPNDDIPMLSVSVTHSWVVPQLDDSSLPILDRKSVV